MALKGRILVVDDEPIVCERLKPALEKIGFYVETHTESQKAIDRLAEEKFDVVVTDIKMKGPDGLEILHFVKQQSPATHVVIITGFATVESAQRGHEEWRRGFHRQAVQDSSAP